MTKQMFRPKNGGSSQGTFASQAASAIAAMQGDSAELVYIDNGFFIFDMERAIVRFSNVAQIFNVRKLESFLGQRFISSLFNLEKVVVHLHEFKEEYIDDTAEGYRRGLRNGTPIDLLDRKRIMQIEGIHSTDPALNLPVSEVSVEPYLTTDESLQVWDSQARLESGEKFYNYVISRNFDTAFSEGSLLPTGNRYRTVCYQFQKIKKLTYNETSESTISAYEQRAKEQFYEFEVQVTDRTGQIFNYMASYFDSSISSYSEYVAAAQADGSYNNIVESFNDFFIQSFKNIYFNNPEDAPYVRLPMWYAFQKDLLYNTYQGNIDLIINAAKSISERVSPTSGTLAEVEKFLTECHDLYDDYLIAKTDANGNGNPKFNYDYLSTFADVETQKLVFGNPGIEAPKTFTSGYTLLQVGDYVYDEIWEPEAVTESGTQGTGHTQDTKIQDKKAEDLAAYKLENRNKLDKKDKGYKADAGVQSGNVAADAPPDPDGFSPA